MRHETFWLFVFIATLTLTVGCSDDSSVPPAGEVQDAALTDVEDVPTNLDVGPSDVPVEDDAPDLQDEREDPEDVGDPSIDSPDGVDADADISLDVADVSLDVADVSDVVDTSIDSDLPNDISIDVEDDGLRDEALIAALLQETTASHTPLDYTTARNYMYPSGGVDEHNGRIECIYTGRTVVANGSRTPCTGCERADGTPISCCFNTEHTWAKYHIRATHPEGTDEYDAAEGDIHHLFPSDEGVNTARWHFPFGPTSCAAAGNCSVDEESELGLAPGSTGTPSCPTGNLELDEDCNMLVRAARRGDVARAQFYMAVRYTMPINDDSEAALRQWHAEDPPDQRELDRNDGIEAAQGNRNPFVDRPEFVERIANF